MRWLVRFGGVSAGLTPQRNLTVIVVVTMRRHRLDAREGGQREGVQGRTIASIWLLRSDNTSGVEFVQGVLLRRPDLGFPMVGQLAVDDLERTTPTVGVVGTRAISTVFGELLEVAFAVLASIIISRTRMVGSMFTLPFTT